MDWCLTQVQSTTLVCLTPRAPPMPPGRRVFMAQRLSNHEFRWFIFTTANLYHYSYKIIRMVSTAVHVATLLRNKSLINLVSLNRIVEISGLIYSRRVTSGIHTKRHRENKKMEWQKLRLQKTGPRDQNRDFLLFFYDIWSRGRIIWSYAHTNQTVEPRKLFRYLWGLVLNSLVLFGIEKLIYCVFWPQLF